MSQETGADSQVDNSGAQGTEVASSSGAAEGKWYDTLPEDMRVSPSIQKFENVETLAKSYLNIEQMVGRDRIPMPKSDDEFMAVYDKLGRPGDPTEYEFGQIEDLDDNLYAPEQREEDKKWFQQLAHQSGLSKKQASTIFDNYMKREAGAQKAMSIQINSQMENAVNQLRSKWGEAYDTNLKVTNMVADKIFPPDVRKAIDAAGLGRSPGFLESLYKLSDSFLEELGIDKRGQATRTPQQLQEELAAIQSHPGYFDEAHPEQKVLMAKAQALMARLYDGK